MIVNTAVTPTTDVALTLALRPQEVVTGVRLAPLAGQERDLPFTPTSGDSRLQLLIPAGIETSALLTIVTTDAATIPTEPTDAPATANKQAWLPFVVR